MPNMPVHEVLFPRISKGFRMVRFVYTEDVGSSSLSSPTIFSKDLGTNYEAVGRFTEPVRPHVHALSLAAALACVVA